jgi:hypothetical protein
MKTLRKTVRYDQSRSQNIGQQSIVKIIVTTAQTIANPPTEQLMMFPGKFAESFTSTSDMVNPLKIPLLASRTLFLKSLVKFIKERVTTIVAAIIPMKKAI